MRFLSFNFATVYEHGFTLPLETAEKTAFAFGAAFVEIVVFRLTPTRPVPVRIASRLGDPVLGQLGCRSDILPI